MVGEVGDGIDAAGADGAVVVGGVGGVGQGGGGFPDEGDVLGGGGEFEGGHPVGEHPAGHVPVAAGLVVAFGGAVGVVGDDLAVGAAADLFGVPAFGDGVGGDGRPD